MSKYDDIINLPHYESKTRKRMSLEARSAQFAPFAALTGYDEKVKETARLTDEQKELNEEQFSIINCKLQIIKEHIKERPLISFTIFIKDKLKDGGSYSTLVGNVRKIDEVNQEVIFVDKTKINFKDIIDVSGEIIKELFFN